MRTALLRVGVVALLLIVACGQTNRPTAEQWRPAWLALVSGIPDESELGNPPDTSICETALTYVREKSTDLGPTPDPTVDTLVVAWVQVAEGAFFGCPPSGPEIDSFAEAYTEMGRIQDEVNLALESEEG